MEIIEVDRFQCSQKNLTSVTWAFTAAMKFLLVVFCASFASFSEFPSQVYLVRKLFPS